MLNIAHYRLPASPTDSAAHARAFANEFCNAAATENFTPTASRAAAIAYWAFLLTFRFLDDLGALNNPLLLNLLYEDQYWQGLRGIYPRCLTIGLAHAGQDLPYMDVHFFQFRNSRGAYQIRTKLYDKRVHIFKGKNLSIVRFLHATSNIPNSSKSNILTGQIHRLARRITDVDNFCYELARIILELAGQGHRFEDLWRRFRDVIHLNQQYYHRDSAHYIITTTESLLVMLRLPPPPPPPPAATT